MKNKPLIIISFFAILSSASNAYSSCTYQQCYDWCLDDKCFNPEGGGGTCMTAATVCAESCNENTDNFCPNDQNLVR